MIVKKNTRTVTQWSRSEFELYQMGKTYDLIIEQGILARQKPDQEIALRPTKNSN